MRSRAAGEQGRAGCCRCRLGRMQRGGACEGQAALNTAAQSCRVGRRGRERRQCVVQPSPTLSPGSPTSVAAKKMSAAPAVGGWRAGSHSCLRRRWVLEAIWQPWLSHRQRFAAPNRHLWRRRAGRRGAVGFLEMRVQEGTEGARLRARWICTNASLPPSSLAHRYLQKQDRPCWSW